MSSILIIAAEASSVLYAQRVIEAFGADSSNNSQDSIQDSISFFGVGSREMEALGFECLGRSEEMAVVGFGEILVHYSRIRKIYYQILEACRLRKPKVALLMDYPGFNLKLMKDLHAIGIKVVYYISPQIWAWKQGRVKIIQRCCDKMLVVFPFEVDFYRTHGVEVEFVGHPLLDEMQLENSVEIQRQKFGIQSDELVVGLMPGSRKVEIKNHLATQLKVANALALEHPKVRLALLVAPSFSKDYFEDKVTSLSSPLIVIKDEPLKMIQMVDVMLAASGTATLMVGLLKKPMVVIYKMSALTALILKCIVKSKFFCIVNLILGKEVVPERFQGEANVPHLTDLMNKYITSPEERQKTSADLAELWHKLGSKGATSRVVKTLKEYL